MKYASPFCVLYIYWTCLKSDEICINWILVLNSKFVLKCSEKWKKYPRGGITKIKGCLHFSCALHLASFLRLSWLLRLSSFLVRELAWLKRCFKSDFSCYKKQIWSTHTGCPKKHVTLFVNAVVFKPRRAKGWHYTHFKAGSMRLETSTHTSHRCV